jgi:hypothetical protein
MSRKAWFLGLAMSLAFAPGVLADTIVNASNSTSGSGSNAPGYFTVSVPKSSLFQSSGCTSGTCFSPTFIPFSIAFSGTNLTGNSLTSAVLNLGSGGAANTQDVISSVSPVSASGCGPLGLDACPFAASQFTLTGSETTTFDSIHSGGLTLAGIAQSNGNFDLFALGFGPQLLAGNDVVVTGHAAFELNSFTLADPGFNAFTQHQFTTAGTFQAGGTLTESFTPTPPPIPTPEPSSLSLLCTGLLAGLATVVRKRV